MAVLLRKCCGTRSQMAHRPTCREFVGTMCRACGKRKMCRPSGLCWSCYYNPEIRPLFPPTSIFANRGVKDFVGRAVPPAPKVSIPGTEEKIAILEARAANGEELFHSDDSFPLKEAS